MNIRAALQYGRDRLVPSDSAHIDARLLLMGLLQRPHSYLIAHDEQELSAAQEARYREWLDQVAQGYPVPYLLGVVDFYGRTFQVSPAVLIPRPESEMLIDAARQWVSDRMAAAQGVADERDLQLVDVGTGSGCLAVTLALELPAARVTAVDISAAALTIAQANGRRYGFEPDSARLRFVQGNLLTAVAPPLDLVVANLPYVMDSEWTDLPDGVKLYEPALALKGGVDGLDLIRDLLIQAGSRLHRPGAILIEIGWQQGAGAAQLARSLFPDARVFVKKDLADHDRLVMITVV
jgi:release factor glutamine methyltransferase